ncbi:MAG: hypothetical protein AVDCRST_MAG76-3186, partial [uncultured Acidimicrobiales bacterium]
GWWRWRRRRPAGGRWRRGRRRRRLGPWRGRGCASTTGGRRGLLAASGRIGPRVAHGKEHRASGPARDARGDRPAHSRDQPIL